MSNKNIKDYYYILGLNKNASKDEIKTAYRKLSVKFHPDKNNGDKFFEERFKDIQEAYETLEDDAKRKIYDDTLSSNNNANSGDNYSYDTYSTQNTGPQSPNPFPPKKRSREILFAIIGIAIVSIPFLKGAINRLDKKEKPETYNLVRYDTTNHTAIDSGMSITIPGDDTKTLPSNTSNQTAGNGSVNTAPSNDNTQSLNFKDDEGYTAQDVVNYFLNALSSSDCTTAWNLSYNNTWVNKGKDWFCSSEAFGTVNKISVRNINTVSQYMTAAAVYAYYYAEDPYNGNKCFKQNITVQKLEYTDGKLRWKITKMTNVEPPVECVY
ncbi:MAG: DnaJ domain-containing protein [Chitinophagaceae bacterium]